MTKATGTYRDWSFTIEKVSGTAIESKKSSTTNIHSSGGGTSVGPNGLMSVSVPKISSYVTNSQELWLSTDDGRELNFVFDGDVAVRDGHELTVTSVEMHNGTKSIKLPIRIENHKTGSSTPLYQNRYFDPGSKIPIQVHAFLVIALPIVVLVLFGGGQGPGTPGLPQMVFTFIAYVTIVPILSHMRKKRFEEFFSKLLEQVD